MGDPRPIDTDIEQAPLVSYEAEQALLAGLLMRGVVVPAVASVIKPEDFADPLHGRIYEAIADMTAQGIRADPITLFRQFKDDPGLNRPDTPLDSRGGKYLVKLLQCVVVTRPDDLADYARHIADLAKRRHLNAVMAELATMNQRALDPDFNIGTALQNLETEISVLRNGPSTDPAIRNMSEIMDAVLEQAEAAYKGGADVRGIATGLLDLDRTLNGLCGGDLLILAGRPGMGKTACALSVARNMGASGHRVGFESIEMSDKQLGLRSIAGPSGVNTTKVRRGTVTEDDMKAMIAAAADLRSLPISISASAAPTIEEISNRWRAHQQRRGLDILVIDYLQLVRAPDKKNGRYEEVTAVSNGLKALAKQLNVPVVALAQLSREVEKRDNKRPLMSDLRESGAIEQDADQIVFLYRHEYYLEKEEPQRRSGEDQGKFDKRMQDWRDSLEACSGIAELIVAKNRHGVEGGCKARFDRDAQRFENLVKDHSPGDGPQPSDPGDQWWLGA